MFRNNAEYIIGIVDTIHDNMFYGNRNTIMEYHIEYYEFMKFQHYKKINGKYKVIKFNETEGMLMEYGSMIMRKKHKR